MAPTVSICIPAYNDGRYLTEALESALAQSSSDIEVIVSDNCSTDGTREIVEAFATRDSRVKYLQTPEHVAMHRNFNFCLERSRGTYVKFLCADDLLESGCVHRMLTALEAKPDARMISCARRVFNSAGRSRTRRYASEDVYCDGREAIRRCFFRGNLIGEPTAVMFRRADVRHGFSDEYPQLVDLEMWFRLLDGGRFYYINDPLCSIRKHDRQATWASVARGGITADKERLFAEYADRAYLQGHLADRLLWDFRMAWSSQRERAAGCFRAEMDALYFPRLKGPMRIAAAAAWQLAGDR